MQYVTKFINVIGSYYGDIGINSANSTGATDVIVVEQADGTYRCTPFHVRFGKLNILRPKEVIVDLYLNNEFVKELNMRVEPTGQAYFELANEDPVASIDFKVDNMDMKITENPNKAIKINNALARELKSTIESSIIYSDDYSLESSGENQANNDTIDPGYRSCDELYSDNKFSQIFDFAGNVKLSLCGNLNELITANPISLDVFFAHALTHDDFSRNPYEIINNPNLVILYNNHFMNWKTFSIIIIARLAYNENIPESFAINISNSNTRTKTGYTKWLRWGSSSDFKEESKVGISSNLGNNLSNVNEDHGLIYSSRLRTLSGDIFFPDNNENDQLNKELTNMDLKEKHNLISAKDIQSRSVDDSAVHFASHGIKKTNVLPHDKLKFLKLNDGVNELFYVITGKYRGTIKVGCKVYLWHWADRIVVSDIDGTITKSDVWGQLAPWLGLDWTQSGIVKLYNSIQKNMFRFVYLSARAIGQADQTRDYLQTVNQEDMFLPDGPLLLSPNSLFIAFKKEVIDKTPEEFKISCLNELRLLFPPEENHHPLYAGFGNKPSDEITYKTVGIPDSKIFTVNKKGELHNKALVSCASNSIKSYDTLTEVVNQYFPSKHTELCYSNEFSSLSFWTTYNHIPNSDNNIPSPWDFNS